LENPERPEAAAMHQRPLLKISSSMHHSLMAPPLRYIGYFNDLGQSIKPYIPQLFVPMNLTCWAYAGAEAASKGLNSLAKSRQMGGNNAADQTAITARDTANEFSFQLLASELAPPFLVQISKEFLKAFGRTAEAVAEEAHDATKIPTLKTVFEDTMSEIFFFGDVYNDRVKPVASGFLDNTLGRVHIPQIPAFAELGARMNKAVQQMFVGEEVAEGKMVYTALKSNNPLKQALSFLMVNAESFSARNTIFEAAGERVGHAFKLRDKSGKQAQPFIETVLEAAHHMADKASELQLGTAGEKFATILKEAASEAGHFETVEGAFQHVDAVIGKAAGWNLGAKNQLLAHYRDALVEVAEKAVNPKNGAKLLEEGIERLSHGLEIPAILLSFAFVPLLPKIIDPFARATIDHVVNPMTSFVANTAATQATSLVNEEAARRQLPQFPEEHAEA
jgi:hypothetical protein